MSRTWPRLTAALVTALAATGTAVPAVAQAAPAASTASCQGRRATIVVAGNNRHVTGTKRSDVIVALGKGDVISGGAGNDVICAGAARSVDGGAGNDRITFWGSAVVHGDAGNDTITQLAVPGAKKVKGAACQGAGNPVLYGDAGNDTLTLGCGNGKAWGGAGNDLLLGGIGNQTLSGDAGNDRLQGGTSGTFVLLGGPGTDVLSVRDAHTSVDGGQGADSISVPARFASTTHIVPDSADLINGRPAATAGGSATVTSTPPASSPTPPPAASTAGLAAGIGWGTAVPAGSTGATGTTTSDDFSSEGSFYLDAVAPAGLTIAGWAVSFGDESVALHGESLPPHTLYHGFDEPGSHVAVLTVADSAGATASSSVTVDVGGQIVTNIPKPTVTGKTVSLDLSGVTAAHAAIDAATVDWGDGNTAAPFGNVTAKPLTHTYTTAGSYQIRLTFTSDHGAFAMATTGVQLSDGLPHALAQVPMRDDMTNFVGYGPPPGGIYKATIDQGLELSYGPSTGTLTVNYGDGTPTGPLSGPGHTYSAPGTYAVTVTATEGAAHDTEQFQVNLVPKDATSVVTLSATTATVGQTITMSTKGTHASTGATLTGYDLAWGVPSDPGLVSASSVPATATHTYTTPGIYYTQIFIADDHGGYAYGNETVTVTGPTTFSDSGFFATLGAQDTSDDRWLPTVVQSSASGAPDSSVTFGEELVDATGRPYSSYTLDFGDGSPTATGTLDGPDAVGDQSFYTGEHAYTKVGEYTASITIHGTGGDVITHSVHISVAGDPVLQVVATASASQGALSITPTFDPGVSAVATSWAASAYVQSTDGRNVTITPSPVEGVGPPPAGALALTNAEPGDIVNLTVDANTDHGYAEQTLQVVVGN